MAPDSSADKRGLKSHRRKQQTTRHADQPAPATSPVPGAFGKEAPGIEPELTDAERDRERAEDESAG
jgi:hypothetical protein